MFLMYIFVISDTLSEDVEISNMMVKQENTYVFSCHEPLETTHVEMTRETCLLDADEGCYSCKYLKRMARRQGTFYNIL